MHLFLSSIHRRYLGRQTFTSRWRLRPSRSYAKRVSEDHPSNPSQWSATVYGSDTVTDRKSVFQAHCTQFTPTSSIDDFLNHLRDHIPRMKRASHMMYAYRTSPRPIDTIAAVGTTGTTNAPADITGQHDGGESGSGDRLARLLQLSGCKDVVVVVSRWYGGTQLGNDRWKRISEVAKESLERGGFLEHKHAREAAGPKKKRK